MVVSMHLVKVFLLNCWGRVGRSFWTLLCCFGEQRGSWWLVLPCLESVTGSTYGRTRIAIKSPTDHLVHETYGLIYI